MSAATEYAPAVCIPAPALGEPERRRHLQALGQPAVTPVRPPVRPAGRPDRIADVAVLHPPRDLAPATRPLRLTRRGVVVLAALVATLAGALLWVAAVSAPASVAAPAGVHSVTVRSGDTLWSIASRVAPTRDPRAEVAALRGANHLGEADLVPGQHLRVP